MQVHVEIERAAEANGHLALYRELIPKEEAQKVRDLEAELSTLEEDIEGQGAAAKIRRFWDEVAGWFTRQSGEVRQPSAL